MARSHKDGLLVRVAGGQIQGARDYQEDNYRVLDLSTTDLNIASGAQFDHTLLILADGMGGHVGGAKASHVAAAEFARAFEHRPADALPHEALLSALRDGNQALKNVVEQDPSLDGMGTTLVVAHIHQGELSWCSVGDSLLYILRNGALQRLNADHSMVPLLDKMVAMGELTPAQAQNDPRRNALRAAVDGQDLDLVDIPTKTYRLQTGDVLVLASDGLETLSETDIKRILTDNALRPVSEKMSALLDRVQSLDLPNQDNTTVIVYEVHDRVSAPSKAGRNLTHRDTSDTALKQRPPKPDPKPVSHSDAVAMEHSNPARTQKSLWLMVIAVSIIIAAMIVAALMWMQFDRPLDKTVSDTPASDASIPNAQDIPPNIESDARNEDATSEPTDAPPAAEPDTQTDSEDGPETTDDEPE